MYTHHHTNFTRAYASREEGKPMVGDRKNKLDVSLLLGKWFGVPLTQKKL